MKHIFHQSNQGSIVAETAGTGAGRVAQEQREKTQATLSRCSKTQIQDPYQLRMAGMSMLYSGHLTATAGVLLTWRQYHTHSGRDIGRQ